MGAKLGNTRLAGEAAARQRAAASEGIQMRRAAMQNAGQPSGNPGVVGERTAVSPTTAARQEMSAARPGQVTPFERSNPSFAPGLQANPPRGGFGGDFGRIEQEMAQKGSPAYEELMQRIRGLNAMQNTGSQF